MPYRSMRGREFDTPEAAIQDNRDYADEMIAADQLAKEQETQFTSPSGCQVWVFIVLIILTIAVPPLWFVWFGLGCLLLGRRR